MKWHPLLALTAGILALAACQPLWADATLEFQNASARKWTVRVVPNGKETGGSLKVGGQVKGIWEEFVLPERAPGSAASLTKVTFHYTLSYAVRFQLIDSNGDWAELASEMAASETFKGAAGFKGLFNNIDDLDFSKVGEAVVFGQAGQQNLRIVKDTLAPGKQAEAKYKVENTVIEAKVGPGHPLLPMGSFTISYLFNRSKVPYVVKAPDPDSKGTLSVTDLKGKELVGSPVGKGNLILPPGTFRLFWIPNGEGLFEKKLLLFDIKAFTAPDKPVLQTHVNIRLKIFKTGEAGNPLPEPEEDKVFEGAAFTTQYSTLQCNTQPGESDITIRKDAFPERQPKSKLGN